MFKKRKRCHKCGWTHTKKNGARNSRIRYKCTICGRQFRSPRKPARQTKKLWDEYVCGKQNLKQLSIKTGRGVKWVRTQLETIKVVKKILTLQPTVFIIDTSFFGRTWGVCVSRSPHLKRNLWWTDVTKEVMAAYHYTTADVKSCRNVAGCFELWSSMADEAW
jgi:hypothetical protein